MSVEQRNDMQGRVLGVIQARMGSSRLPGKALIDLAGKPLVWHMIDRMRRVKGVSEIVLATTADTRNKPLIDFCKSLGIDSFQHEVEDDLAGRISGAIRGRTGDIILKTGGDCPLIDPVVLQRMVDTALADPCADFVSNRVQWSYPLGLSADVISRRSIEWADANL
ncbi:MAG: NTP transferase domain-containing protein, partial [Alphaproteobacteria bacterium]|nr:NTP transferase domain-containing protein [Alphaproteobacteria bacterium]